MVILKILNTKNAKTIFQNKFSKSRILRDRNKFASRRWYLDNQSLKKLYVVLELKNKSKTKPIGMCIDIPVVNSKAMVRPFHYEFPQQRSSFLGTMHLLIILLRQVRYNKDWRYE